MNEETSPIRRVRASVQTALELLKKNGAPIPPEPSYSPDFDGPPYSIASIWCKEVEDCYALLRQAELAERAYVAGDLDGFGQAIFRIVDLHANIRYRWVAPEVALGLNELNRRARSRLPRQEKAARKRQRCRDIFMRIHQDSPGLKRNAILEQVCEEFVKVSIEHPEPFSKISMRQAARYTADL